MDKTGKTGMRPQYVASIHETLRTMGVLGLSRTDVGALLVQVKNDHQRLKDQRKQMKKVLQVLRFANRYIGKDWPIVSLSVAVAIDMLGGDVRKSKRGRKKR